MSASKLRLLLSVLGSNPEEFYDRIRAVLEVRRDRAFEPSPRYASLPWSDVVRGVLDTLDVPASQFDRELEQLPLAAAMAKGIADLGDSPEFTLRHNADLQLARLCYVVCRARRPEVVIETGVAYGVTTSFVLQALDMNGHGHLHSIDLPPLGANATDAVGRLVPSHLRSRWTLHRGASRRILPPLLARTKPVDVFIHDSLHTFGNMSTEFTLADRHRSERFVLIADDIELNGAFDRYVESAADHLAFHAVCGAEAKDSRAGICVSV